MLLFARWAAVFLVFASFLAGCRGWDEDLRYFPQQRGAYLLLQKGGQARLARWANAEMDTAWGAKNGLNAPGGISIQAQKLWATDQTTHNIRRYNLINSYWEWEADLPGIPGPVAAGFTQVVAGFSNGRSGGLYFFEADKPKNRHQSDLDYIPRGILYSGGKFIVWSDSLLCLYNESAAAEVGRFHFPQKIHSVAVGPGLAIFVLLGETAPYAQAGVDGLDEESMSHPVKSKLLNIGYSPFLKPDYDTEFLGNLSLQTDNHIYYNVSGTLPYPIHFYSGLATDFEADFQGSNLYLLRNDSLFEHSLRSGTLRPMAAGYTQVTQAAFDYRP